MPFIPVHLFEEATKSEPHDFCCAVQYIARVHEFVPRPASKGGAVGEVVEAVIQLVMGELREVVFQHDWKAFVGDVWGYFGVREYKGAGERMHAWSSKDHRSLRNGGNRSPINRYKPSATDVGAPPFDAGGWCTSID